MACFFGALRRLGTSCISSGFSSPHAPPEDVGGQQGDNQSTSQPADHSIGQLSGIGECRARDHGYRSGGKNIADADHSLKSRTEVGSRQGLIGDPRGSVAVILTLERTVLFDADIGRLFGRELRQLRPEFGEVQSSDFLVQVLGKDVDLAVVVSGVLP